MAKRFRQARKLASKILRKLGRGNKLQSEPTTIPERPDANDANDNNQQPSLEEVSDIQSINWEQTRGQFQIVNGFDFEEGPELYYGLDQIQDEEPYEYFEHEAITPELVSEDSDKESDEIIEIPEQNNNIDEWEEIPKELENDNWGSTPEETNSGNPWVEGNTPGPDNWYPWSRDFVPQNATCIETTNEIQRPTTTFIPITYLKYKRQPLPCGCDKRKLQEAATDHMARNFCTRKKNFHCCKCSRPLAKDEVYEGTNLYHQLCRSCDRIEKYDITNESWYREPCQVCGQPLEQKENISWNNYCCSTPCKYAYLAIMSSQTFEHIPTRVYHYLNTGRGKYHEVDESEVLEKARNFYIKLNGEPEPERYDTRMNNNLETWNEARDRAYFEAQEAVDYLWESTLTYLNNHHDEEYIWRMNESFNNNREAAIARLPTILDLTEDNRLKLAKFNLCHNCYFPFSNEDLRQTNDRKFLCIKTDMNPEPCWIDPITNEITNIIEEAHEVCKKDFGKEIRRQEENQNYYCKCYAKTFLTEKQKARYHRRICRDERKKFSSIEN